MIVNHIVMFPPLGVFFASVSMRFFLAWIQE